MNDGRGLPFLTRDMLAFQEGKTIGIEIDIVTDTSCIFTIKGLTKESSFGYNVEVNASTTIQTFSFAVGDVPITMTGEIKTLGTPVRYAKLSGYLTINQTRVALLFQGNLNGNDAISWPSQLPFTELQKRGQWYPITSELPAVGAYPILTTPDNVFIRLQYATVSLTTSAAVANRQLILDLKPASANSVKISTNVIQTAGTTKHYRFIEGINDVNDTINNVIQSGLPRDFWLPARSQATIEIGNFDAGDQLFVLNIFGERHITRIP